MLPVVIYLLNLHSTLFKSIISYIFKNHYTNPFLAMRKKNKYKTDFLLPKNNFLIGLGSVLNISGSYFEYNCSESEEEADKKALFSDWYNVGNDLKVSLKDFKKKHSEELSIK